MKSEILANNYYHILIAAPKSNSGKTLISLALMRAFKDNGIKVYPFKCGPDFIDPFWHFEACGKESINLDLFMMPEKHISYIYNQNIEEGSIGITEGVMGLFDGAIKDKGSSAEIAQLLNIPIILVVDASAMAYSAAPLLYGFKNFSKKTKIGGVIFNKVNSLNHYQILKEAAQNVQIECLGYFPKNGSLGIPSRHLGLYSGIKQDYEKIIEEAANQIKQYVDLKKILSIAKRIPPEEPFKKTKRKEQHKLNISIAKDEAFSFMYKKNIEKLKEIGEITFFSPLHDQTIPKSDFIYLPGGYPELFLDELHKNISMRNTIKEFCENDGAVYAECGGMMYLGKSIKFKEKDLEMVNFLDITTGFDKKFTLGYRKLKMSEKTIKGHEFHYSSINESNETMLTMDIYNAKKEPVETSFFKKKNTMASYLHLYWGNNDKFLDILFKQLLIEEKSTSFPSTTFNL